MLYTNRTTRKSATEAKKDLKNTRVLVFSCRLSGLAMSGHLILLRNVLDSTVFIGRMMERGSASQDKQLLCSLPCSSDSWFAAGIAEAASIVMSTAGMGRPPSFINTDTLSGRRLKNTYRYKLETSFWMLVFLQLNREVLHVSSPSALPLVFAAGVTAHMHKMNSTGRCWITVTLLMSKCSQG